MAKPVEFMKQYGIGDDEIWEVRGGIWAVKHSALERVAAEQDILFDRPAVLEIDSEKKVAVLCVFGTLKERHEWSIGEAAPHNNKNGYPAAMAEKRAKDRVTLKLLNAHGAIYSDSEAEDFAQQQAPTLPKKDARLVYDKLQREIREFTSRDQLNAWMQGNKDRIAVLPEDWQQILRTQCAEALADLRNKEAA